VQDLVFVCPTDIAPNGFGTDASNTFTTSSSTTAVRVKVEIETSHLFGELFVGGSERRQ
jgi:hypothetical protein